MAIYQKKGKAAMKRSGKWLYASTRISRHSPLKLLRRLHTPNTAAKAQTTAAALSSQIVIQEKYV